MVAGGALWAIGLAALDVAYRAIVTAPGSVPAAAVSALGGASLRNLGWYLLTIGVPMVFPDGHLVGPRWRWLPWGLAVVVTGSLVDTLTAPGANLSQLGAWPNPLALPQALQPINALAFWASVPLGLVVLAAVVVQLVVRWRRGGPLVRRQLTLFAVAAALPMVAIPVTFATGLAGCSARPRCRCRSRSGSRCWPEGCTTSTGLSAARSPTGCSPWSWAAATPGSCSASASSWAGTLAWSWPPPP
jgi:hypothetical protein